MKKNDKNGLKKRSQIKTSPTAAAATAASTSICESRPVAVLNDEVAWFAHIDKHIGTACKTVKVSWSLDSACSIHLAFYCGSFDTYETVPIGQHHVTVVNGYRMPVVGIGTVRLEMTITALNQGNKALIKNVVINDVLYTPESKESVISVSCLTEGGLKVKFDQFDAVFSGYHGVEGTAKGNDQMYVIDQCTCSHPEQ